MRCHAVHVWEGEGGGGLGEAESLKAQWRTKVNLKSKFPGVFELTLSRFLIFTTKELIFSKVWSRDRSIDSESFSPKTHILGIMDIFSPDMSQIIMTSNLLKKAFATWQHAFRSTSVAFYSIFAWACAQVKFRGFWTRKWPTIVDKINRINKPTFPQLKWGVGWSQPRSQGLAGKSPWQRGWGGPDVPLILTLFCPRMQVRRLFVFLYIYSFLRFNFPPFWTRYLLGLLTV